MADRRTAHYVSGHQVSIIRYQPSASIMYHISRVRSVRLSDANQHTSHRSRAIFDGYGWYSISTVVQPWRHRPTKAVLKGDYPTPTMGQDAVAALDPTLGR